MCTTYADILIAWAQPIGILLMIIYQFYISGKLDGINGAVAKVSDGKDLMSKFVRAASVPGLPQEIGDTLRGIEEKLGEGGTASQESFAGLSRTETMSSINAEPSPVADRIPSAPAPAPSGPPEVRIEIVDPQQS